MDEELNKKMIKKYELLDNELNKIIKKIFDEDKEFRIFFCFTPMIFSLKKGISLSRNTYSFPTIDKILKLINFEEPSKDDSINTIKFLINVYDHLLNSVRNAEETIITKKLDAESELSKLENRVE